MLLIFLYQAFVLLLHFCCVALFDVKHNDVHASGNDKKLADTFKTFVPNKEHYVQECDARKAEQVV